MSIDDPIVIVDHDPRWAGIFAAEAARITAALGGRATAVHHIGSTAVPGMAAKPVIDMLVEVRVAPGDPAIDRALTGLGFTNLGEFGIPDRVFFRLEGTPPLHVHVFAAGHPSVARDLGFRDRLRGDPALVREYSEMKRRLAAAHRDDRPAYSRGKEDFIVAAAGPRPAARWA